MLDGEVIVVNLDSGAYYSLAEVAAAIWASVERGATAEEAADESLTHYDASSEVVRPAVLRFVDELAGEGLIVASEEARHTPDATVPPPPLNGARIPFAEPVLNKYTDMQELLLLDPIHEVDDAGWPSRPAGGA